jgi:hypothetical protein
MTGDVSGCQDTLSKAEAQFDKVFAAGRELRQWRTEVWVQDINDRLLALMAAS